MSSITKPKPDQADIERIVEHTFGKQTRIIKVEEVHGGFFNAAYWLTLDGGKEYIMKIAPSPIIRVLRFEEKIIETEVMVSNLLAEKGFPVPRIHWFDQTGEILANDYLIMEKMDGVPLSICRSRLTVEEQRMIDLEIGRYTRKINEIQGDKFGHFLNPNKQSKSWRKVFDTRITDILQDGIDLGVILPLGYQDIYDLLKDSFHTLNLVIQPSLVHYDLWDGNVLINERKEISGLVDCERAFWGDPLMETNFASFAVQPSFLEGYGTDLLADDIHRRRRFLYDIYHFLVASIEVTNRQYENRDYEIWANENLMTCLNKLKESRV
ncbi:Phosphotransferase enzyme family protein [compost metagenome]